MKLNSPYQGRSFFDHPSSNLDYREIEFGTDVDLNVGRAELSAGLERTLRSFNNFDVGNAGETLFYGYWTGDAGVEYRPDQAPFL